MRIDTTSGDYDFTYLSLGAGVQSSALLVLSLTDPRVPRPDAVIFADTGDEPPWVYEYVDILTGWAKPYGVKVETVTAGVLSEYVTKAKKGNIMLPVFVSGDGAVGMLRRTCTERFKIRPIKRRLREILGYESGQSVTTSVRALMGISIDEAQRMKESPERWITNAYPLVDLMLDRQACIGIVEAAGLPTPERSACVYCPYHSDDYWHWMKQDHPAQFARAVAFDHSLRATPDLTVKKVPYVHRSCVPLDEVVFDTTDPHQIDMWAECEGVCGV